MIQKEVQKVRYIGLSIDMSYLTSIEKAIIVFPLIALLFTIPFVLQQYHKYGSIHKLRVLIIYSFILYFICIYFLVILPLPKRDTVVWKPDRVRIVPFQFIMDFIKDTSFRINNPSTYFKALLEPCFYTVIFNVFMFVPFGMYLRYYFRCNFKKVMGCSFLLSLFFEVTQLTGLYFIYPYPYRIFDVDDLIINTLGGILGYLLMGKMGHFLPTREKMDAESFQIGKSVSGLRRITIFCLDFVIYNMLNIILFLMGMPKYSFLIFLFYYGIYPMISNGKTLGSQFLNVRFDCLRWKGLRILLRHILLYVYYFGIPIAGLYVTVQLVWVHFQPITAISVCFISIPFIFLFYMVNAVFILKKKRRFYDVFFGITYHSTIDVEKNKKAEEIQSN